MLAVQTFPQVETNSHNCQVKSLLTEEFIIKNVIGNHQEIPQIIYKMIQDCLSRGKQINAILKWKSGDSCYWINSFFKPGKQNYFRQGFKIETQFLTTKCQQNIKKLYAILIDIEKNSGIEYAKKYLEGYLEEKGIYFNELPKYLN
ncbi:MAG TPA: hypothetical protein ENK67_06775 [Flavobacteriia bacterium]|jgi:hypothetical protein|nr:hypothetical protein [Flavobacteriia bacterium]